MGVRGVGITVRLGQQRCRNWKKQANYVVRFLSKWRALEVVMQLVLCRKRRELHYLRKVVHKETSKKIQPQTYLQWC